MVDFAVSPGKNAWLRQKMTELNILEKDILEKFVRSSGNGGQKVNKTASCVYLKHLPTGTEVKCMKDRSQSVNRFLARRELADKIERLTMGQESSAARIVMKIRKQKSKRKKRALKAHGGVEDMEDMESVENAEDVEAREDEEDGKMPGKE
ncbi:MAG: peptide chain release factor-like protein [Nitrospirae bacterium]|nr:peptide chain release factor-like protein [Nitrospirota bacterium]